MHQLHHELSTTDQWYVVQCKSRGERQAAAMLHYHLNIAIYLPAVRCHGGKDEQYAPFFPGYLFVCVNLHEVALSQINSTPGVVRMVAFDGMPQSIPASVIAAIRTHVVHFNRHGGLPQHRFQPGETVRIKHGPFQGLEAVFAGPMKPNDRVQVLLTFMGQLRKTEVNTASLEPVDPQLAIKRERRTRGKGRPIKNSSEASWQPSRQ